MFTFPLIFLHHVSKESLDSAPVITQGSTGAPAATGANVNTQQVPCLLPAGWLACSLYVVRVACVHGSGGRDDVGGLPSPSVVLSAGRTLSILLLLPTACFPWLFRSGSWVFLVSVPFVQNCPNCSYMRWFLVPYSCLVSCCLRSMCPGASIRPRVSGPSLSQKCLWRRNLCCMADKWMHGGKWGGLISRWGLGSKQLTCPREGPVTPAPWSGHTRPVRTATVRAQACARKETASRIYLEWKPHALGARWGRLTSVYLSW